MAKSSIIGSGSLDLENDPLIVRKGDYRDALDVTPISDGNGVTTSYEPVLGNEFAFDMGSITPQPKVIRIYLGAGSDSYTLTFKRYNYITIGTTTFAQDVNPDITVDNAVTAIMADIPDSVVTFDYATSTVDVRIVPSGFLDYWDFVISSSGTAVATFQTIQESVDVASAGDVKPIGSYDLLGELFVWGATGRDNISTLVVDSVFDASGLVGLVVPNNGIVDGTAVKISGIVDNSGNDLSGEWIAVKLVTGGYIDADRIILLGSTYDAAYVLTNPTVAVNLYSVGVVGVSVKDVILDTINYYQLIASKALNLRTKFQVHAYCETDQIKKSIYWCDGELNPIRVMYYYGQYMNGGFLSSVNPVGRYTLDTLYEESKLFLSDTNVTVTFDGTTDSAGQLNSGNYRYAVRFITENETTSEWTSLSNVINIYSASFTGYTRALMGDADGTVTGKINNFTVSNIPVGVFKYIQLGYVIYQGIGQAAFGLSRLVITGASMQLTHTGYETIESVDLGTLNNATVDYKTAHSIDVLNNKMILSNLTVSQISDFSAFFQTLEHSLEQELIPSVGESNTVPFDNYQFGEYFDTSNTYYKKTFVHNETYRFGAQVKLKGGKLLPNIFWIDDIRIDTNPINVASPVNRRIAALPNYMLVDTGGTEDTYIAKVVFSNINWNYIINGQRLIDLVERIYIMQVEMTAQYQEVLATGLFVQYANDQSLVPATGSGFVGNVGVAIPENASVANTLGEFNFCSGNTECVFSTVYNDYTGVGSIGPNYAAFYSPDDYYGNADLTLKVGDALACARPNTGSTLNTNNATQALGANAFKGKYFETFGPQSAGTFSIKPIDEAHVVPRGGSVLFTAHIPNQTINKTNGLFYDDSLGNNYDSFFEAPSSPVFYCATAFIPSFGTEGYGYAQYYRFKNYGAKFGDKALSKYVPTGAYLDAPAVTVSNDTMDTYGDAFTQSNIYHLRYPRDYNTAHSGGGGFSITGWGFGIIFYSQNRVNSQMRNPTNGVPSTIPPDLSVDNWLNEDTTDPVSYTQSYTPRNQINILPAFDPNAVDVTKLITRIAYSQSKPNGSQTDEYRKFLPLDFRDLDMAAGEIIHHVVSNGELLTWQQRSFQRQYFNSNGLLQNANGSEIILGDGAALSRRGLQLSSIGSKHKWGICKGVSNGGNDVMAWINTEYGYVVRFGYDGVKPISVIHNINGFIDKNTKWADIRFTPADDEGIHAVWNDERKEYIWTVRARRTTNELYNPEKYYNAGQSVYVYETGQIPTIYIARQNTIQYISGTGVVIPYTDSVYWLKDTDQAHYNNYTLAFNELKNGFSTFYSFIPKIYMKWKKGYLSANPFFLNLLSIHNKGQYALWYQQLQSNPYITMLMNDQPDMKKSFHAIELNSKFKPLGMEFKTEQHQSHLTQADFDSDELHDIMYSSWIKNDSTVSADNPLGLNDIDTSNLFGEYMEAKFIFEPLTYNKLLGTTISYVPRTRLNTT